MLSLAILWVKSVLDQAAEAKKHVQLCYAHAERIPVHVQTAQLHGDRVSVQGSLDARRVRFRLRY